MEKEKRLKERLLKAVLSDHDNPICGTVVTLAILTGTNLGIGGTT